MAALCRYTQAPKAVRWNAGKVLTKQREDDKLRNESERTFLGENGTPASKLTRERNMRNEKG